MRRVSVVKCLKAFVAIGGMASFALLVAPAAFAQGVTNTTAIKGEKAKAQKKVSAWATMTTLSSLHMEGDPKRASVGQLKLGMSYQLGQKASAEIEWPFVQQLNRAKKSVADNATITFVPTTLRLNLDTELTPLAFATAPTNVEDRDKRSYFGGAGLGGQLRHQSGLFARPFITTYSASLSKDFHQYTRSASSEANVSHSFDQAVSLTLRALPKLSLTISGAHSMGWTYRNSTREQFSLAQTISYQPNTSFIWSIGHRNGGDVLATDGQNHRISFYDRDQSAVFASMTAIY